MTQYANFRQRLDAVLRTLDVQQVQQFLIDEKQWSAAALPADPEFSMYMMIAGSAALRDLHGQARAWLMAHGHAEEAQAVLGKGKQGPGAGQGGQRSHHHGKSAGEQKRKGSAQQRGPRTHPR